MGQVLTEWLGGSSVFVIHACESGIHGFRRSGDERGLRRSGDERHDNLAGALLESLISSRWQMLVGSSMAPQAHPPARIGTGSAVK